MDARGHAAALSGRGPHLNMGKSTWYLVEQKLLISFSSPGSARVTAAQAELSALTNHQLECTAQVMSHIPNT